MAGKFLKPHGLQGELNAVTEYPAEILEEGFPLIVDMDGIYVPFYVASFRPKNTFGSLIRIDGVDTAEDARKFVNKEFFLRRTDVAAFLQMEVDEIETEEDFTGYKLYDQNNDYVGRIEYVDYTTANILLHVKPDGAEDDSEIIYVPIDDSLILAEYIDEENPEENALQVEIPHGVIDLNRKK